jgi:hypothetical protein
MVSNTKNFFENPLDFIRDDKLINILKGKGNLLGILDLNWQNINTTPNITKIDNIFNVGNKKFQCGIVHPNGKIYAIPYNHNNVLEIDVENRTKKVISIPISNLNSIYYNGVALHPNGKIYSIPMHASAEDRGILEIN